MTIQNQGLLGTFKWDLIITAVTALIVGFIPGLGWGQVPIVLILAVLEWSLSFDNAIVNAKVLVKMSAFWQKIFMTFGLAFAVGFMRLLFPILIVFASAKLGFFDTISLALHDPVEYGRRLDAAGVIISTFAGTYLLLIASGFLFDNEREDYWLKWIEAPLAKAGKWDNLKYLVAVGFLLVAGATFGHTHMVSVLVAGMTAIAVYLAVESFSNFFEAEDEEDDGNGKKVVHAGIGAFAQFVYLEVQDSAFSFDGVSGAFAISSVVLVIAIGLGLGAMYVRTMTVHLVRTGHLRTFRYLEHGAYYAITALAVCLLLGIADIDVPKYITGVIGIVAIGTALWSSIRANKRDAIAGHVDEALAEAV
jgi:hypothetical protein